MNACVVDAALIDTGLSTLLIVGNDLLNATRVASVRNTKPALGNKTRKIGGIGATISTLGTTEFYFLICGRECMVTLHVVPGRTLPTSC